MGILNKIFGSTSSNEDDKYVLYLSLALQLAAVDGVGAQEEENKIYEFFLSDLKLTKEHYNRIRNKVDSVGEKTFSTIDKLNDDDKVELLNFLVDMATSAGHFHGDELVFIVTIGAFLGLDHEKLFDRLTSMFEVDQDEINKAFERAQKHMKDKGLL